MILVLFKNATTAVYAVFLRDGKTVINGEGMGIW